MGLLDARPLFTFLSSSLICFPLHSKLQNALSPLRQKVQIYFPSYVINDYLYDIYKDIRNINKHIFKRLIQKHKFVPIHINVTTMAEILIAEATSPQEVIIVLSRYHHRRIMNGQMIRRLRCNMIGGCIVCDRSHACCSLDQRAATLSQDHSFSL